MAVDLEKVEQQLEKMIAALSPYTEGDAPNNVISRIQVTVIPAFIRWKAGEMNRRSDQNDVLNAFVAFVSSQMAGLIHEIADPGEEFELANSLLQGIAEEVASVFTGDRKMGEFHVPTEAAH